MLGHRRMIGTVLRLGVVGVPRCALAGASETQSFDPDGCWEENDGKIVIRLISGLAFAFEPTSFHLRTRGGPITDPDLPPEGCPGNWLVAKSDSVPHPAIAARELGDAAPPPPLGVGL